MRLGRPLGAGETIDVETAPASELSRLPRVGPRLAKEIVANREAQGPFGGLTGLDRVSGIGPGLLKVIGPHVVFGGVRGEARKRGSGDVSGSRETLQLLPSPPPRLPASPLIAPLNLNTATLDQLLALPGVGPAKAAAVVRYRSEHGPFAKPEDLTRVSGFGPAALARLKNLIAAP
jgi:competence protein ComEA